jgi:uncharacterized lipoprotein YbaY
MGRQRDGIRGAIAWAAWLAAALGPAAVGQEPRLREDPAAAANARYLPPGTAGPGGRYVLGINVRNWPAGVEVVTVQPGSVAQRSGIEPGDVIVTVGGFQVGYVGDRLHDLGDEIARRIDGYGRVMLLVRNHRTGGLVSVPVQFGAAGSRAVVGRLSVQPPVALPPTAVVTVRVLDVTHAQWSDVAVAQGQAVAAAFPLPYRLDLPALYPQHRYAVDARIEDRGLVLARTAAPTMLAAIDRDQQVDLVLAAGGVGPVGGAGSGLLPADQIQQWIQLYLGRPPRPFEIDVWLATLQRGRSLVDVQAGILSSSELFERAGRSRDIYVAEVFRLLFGGPPNAAQLADLRSRYDRAFGVRLRFIEDLLRQPR